MNPIIQAKFDRIQATIQNNCPSFNREIIADIYGLDAIGIESDLGPVQIRALEKEFGIVHFLDGKIVVY